MQRQQIITALSSYKHNATQYPIARLGVFGSYARNENKADSDIDILVELNGDIGWECFDLASDLKNIFSGYKVDVVSRNAIPDLYWNEIKNEVMYA
ncbi:nucleotidyltransferase family protein [Niabella ginsengisoli]|uniref:Nucleotidyltransferase family protein n=1 Tax=Niabella ginsengisoli TaxID=522298 RepID=A0ABS9SQJ8_9BACT|nr:nucleotidyltransferase family protein [Niabella ginsengisoli]MCH5600668.1 nucleotidyltransferase family protein [Niabella ginsengisoli]